jgi:hypothetical protein
MWHAHKHRRINIWLGNISLGGIQSWSKCTLPIAIRNTCKNTQHSNNIFANTYYKTQLQCTLHTMPTQKV